MGFGKLITLALLGLQASFGLAQDEEKIDLSGTPLESFEDKMDPTKMGEESNIRISAAGHIPQKGIFGIKLVNNEPTRATLQFNNSEPFPLTLAFAVGQLSMPQGDQILKNLTAVQYSTQVPAEGSLEVIYSFTVEMHPQDLNLRVVAMLLDDKGSIYSVPVIEEAVSIVEAPTSIFDPQIIFLYLVLGAAFGGTCYFIYTTWIATLFPQKKRTSGYKGKKPAESAPEGESSATTTGSKGYDESWIQPQHLNRPESRRVKSGTPRTKARG